MSSLRNAISQLASKFAAGVLDAIRNASIEDLLREVQPNGAAPQPVARAAVETLAAPTPGRRRGRLVRRSADNIAQVVERMVALLGAHPKGLRSEQLRDKLGLRANEIPRPIAQDLAERKISKVGEKRATTYFAGAAKAVAAKTPPEPTAKVSKPAGKISKPSARKPAAPSANLKGTPKAAAKKAGAPKPKPQPAAKVAAPTKPAAKPKKKAPSKPAKPTLKAVAKPVEPKVTPAVQIEAAPPKAAPVEVPS